MKLRKKDQIVDQLPMSTIDLRDPWTHWDEYEPE